MSRKVLAQWSDAYSRFKRAELELLSCQLRGQRVPPELAVRVSRLRAEADELFEQAQEVILEPTGTPSRWAALGDATQPAPL